MERLLSSRWTFFQKFLFPALWVAGFGLVTLLFFVDPADVVYDGVRGGAPPGVGWIFLAAWLAGGALVLWVSLPLQRVRLVDDALLVSNFARELRVPFGMIAEVRQNRWVSARPITVRLRADVPGLGRRFTFIPPTRLRFAVWREDPEVAELRRLAGLRGPEGAPRLGR